MTSIQRVMRVLAVMVLVGAGFGARSDAATITIVPGGQIIPVGGTATVDIVLSGLTPLETVGGFSMLLSFNDTILGAPVSYVNDPGGMMGPLPLDFSLGFTGVDNSPLDLFMLADGSITEPALKALQGTGFVLASVSFTGLVEGLSPLALSVSPSTGVFLSAFDGVTEIPAGAVSGSVCVDDTGTGVACQSVPEPGILALLGVGVSAVVARRRRRARPEQV